MNDDSTRSAPASKPDYTALEFPDPPSGRPYVVINMVASADGKTVIEGTERGLGSRTDQHLLRELRVHPDVVLNGAGTLRASGASSRLNDLVLEEIRVRKGKTRLPTAAVLSGSGDLPLQTRFFTGRGFDAVVYLSERAPAERAHAVVASGRPVYRVPAGDEVPSMVRHMREQLGCRLLLLEGGSTINGDFFRHGLADELFLTVSGLVVGGEHGVTAVETPGLEATRAGVQRLELLAAHPNPATNELYLRYRVLH